MNKKKNRLDNTSRKLGDRWWIGALLFFVVLTIVSLVHASLPVFAVITNCTKDTGNSGKIDTDYSYCSPNWVPMPEKMNVAWEMPEYLTSTKARQQKFGDLYIGPIGAATNKSWLCLNANTDKKLPAGVNDTANCIQAWSQITDLIPSYLRLQSTVPITADEGYVSIIANPDMPEEDCVGSCVVGRAKLQHISLITEANGSSSNPVATAGLEAISKLASGYAAIFKGKVQINAGAICLTPDAGHPKNFTYQGIDYNCQSSIAGATAAPIDIINLRLPTKAQPWIQANTGNASLGGPFTAEQGIILGVPATTSSHVRYCGDLVCSPEDQENHARCPSDCVGE